MPHKPMTKTLSTQLSTSPAPVFVGIDVGAYFLDVHICQQNSDVAQAFRVENVPQGHKKIARTLKKFIVVCIVCEATGKLERPVARALSAQGLAVTILNPAQSVNFRKVCGKIAKTDKLDAALLARFAQLMKPVARPLPSAHILDLRDLVVRRRQVIATHVAESNRSLRTESALAKRHIATVLRLLERQGKELDKAIMALIEADYCLRAKFDLLHSIPGIGPVAAFTLLAEMPELGGVEDKAVSALAGLAPMNNDSGMRFRRAKCRGGRKSVRTVLYLAAMAARRFNKPISIFYERLISKGKPKLVALNAAMRKLLIIANHVLATGKPWLCPTPAA